MASLAVDGLVFGCGYLGRRVAARWRKRGRSVAAVTRGRAAELEAAGIAPIVADVLDPASLGGLPSACTILYAVAVPRPSTVIGVTNALAALSRASPQAKLLFVSTTSVYGQTDGGEVDEDSPTEPREEAGRVALEAEAVVRSAWPGAVVLRFAGLYGPGRWLSEAAIRGGDILPGDGERWLNLIHGDDGADAVLAAEARGEPDRTYIVSDGSPIRRREYYSALAEALAAPAPRFAGTATGEPNRRLSSQRLRTELGVAPRYPDCRAGIREGLNSKLKTDH